MDKIHKEFKEKVEKTIFRHFEKILGGRIGIIFYNMTTLYFETPNEDDLAKSVIQKTASISIPRSNWGSWSVRRVIRWATIFLKATPMKGILWFSFQWKVGHFKNLKFTSG